MVTTAAGLKRGGRFAIIWASCKEYNEYMEACFATVTVMEVSWHYKNTFCGKRTETSLFLVSKHRMF